MAKIRLEPLKVEFHEPDLGLLDSALANQRWELQCMAMSKPYAQPSRIGRLSREIGRKKSSVKQLEKERDILRNWRVQLDPYVDSLELLSLYKHKGVPIPSDIGQWSKRFAFYELTFGGDIFVEKGMSVKKLEMGIVFDPKLRKGARHSVAYSIFPRNEWKKYGEASVVFGLSGNLGFQVPLAPNGVPFGKIGNLGPQVKAQFLLGPFIYAFKKAVIRGAGKGNYMVNWIIEKGDILEGGDFETRVVLKVPKRRRSVKAMVAMQATVTVPGFWKRLLGETKKMPSEEKVYKIPLRK